jgi:hypothetical protein
VGGAPTGLGTTTVLRSGAAGALAVCAWAIPAHISKTMYRTHHTAV